MKGLRYYLETLNNKYYVAYVGKFAPFHKGHYFVYNYLCNLPNITKDDVYICTTFKDTDFLTIEQKKEIIKRYGIDETHIINQSGYNIHQLLSAMTGGNVPENAVLMSAFSDKDLEDKSKVWFLQTPKDNIKSWRIIKDINDIQYLRPYNYVHKEYESSKEKKEQKGNAYLIITPTVKQKQGNISSSLLRQSIGKIINGIDKNKEFQVVRNIMDNDKAFQYLMGIKNIK